MLRNLIVGFVVVFSFASIVYAAPYFRQEAGLVPLTDSTYYLGTTTPSINAWAGVVTDQLCLSADCRTSWPTGSGGGFPFTPVSYGNATSTTIGFLNGLLSTASSTFTGTFRLSSLSDGGLAVFGGTVSSGATTTAGTGLTYSGNSFNVNTSQNIATLSNLTGNGFVKTSGGTGALSIDTTTYESGLTAGDGLTRTVNDFDCDTASGSVFGCLSSADWTTFNNKQAAISATWPITLSGSTLGFNGLSTSTAPVVGNIPYFSGVNTFANVATTTLTASSPLALSQPISVIGSSASALSIDTSGAWTGNAATASALFANGSNCSAGSAAGGVSAAGVAEDCTDYWTEAENTSAAYTPQSRTLTVAGTANQVTSSAGAQDLSANRTWTLSFPTHIVQNSALFTLSTTTNATSTNHAVTNLLTFNGVTGSTWAAFCTSITGGSGLCDGSDDGGAGGGNSKWATSTADTSAIHTATALRVGIGTTTPRWALTIATSTEPQLTLTDGTNAPWNLRSVSGNLLFSTSSPTTYATTSTSALTLSGSGNPSLSIGTSSPFALFSMYQPAGQVAFAIGSSTTSMMIDRSGKLVVRNVDKGYSGVLTPDKHLPLQQGTSTNWVGTTTGSYTGRVIMPFDGTARAIRCGVDNTFIDWELYGAVTAYVRSASSSPGIFALSGTFTAGSNLYFRAGTSTNLGLATTTSCTLTVTETP